MPLLPSLNWNAKDHAYTDLTRQARTPSVIETMPSIKVCGGPDNQEGLQ